MDEQEIWRPIKGYDGRYEVSNLGRVNFTEAAVAKHNQKEARQ